MNLLTATLWLATLAEPQAAVTGLQVLPAGGQTEIVIAVDGPVATRDFLLTDPVRLVVDLSGARHALPAERFAVGRGGVRAVRTSQFQPNVVRVVVELDAPVRYTVIRADGAIRIAFPNPGGAFTAWSVGTARTGTEPAWTDRNASAGTGTGPARTGPQPVTGADPARTAQADDETPGPATTAPAAFPAPPAAAAPSARAAPAAQRRPQERRITVHFQQTSILDVLATFAEFSGRSIVAGANVTGTVTADIRDQPWDVALDAILQAHGLAARETESGIIRVDAVDKIREREKVEDLVTRQYPIRYVPVDSLVNTVKGFLSERGKVTTNPAANALVITEARSVLERIEPTIAQLDVRRPQVTISAKIIFIDRTALEEFGITYDLKDAPNGNQLKGIAPGWIDKDGDGVFDDDEQVDDRDIVLLRGNSIAALANAKYRPTAPSLQVLTSLALNRHSLISFIEALQQLQLSDIQASPVVTTMDNREARIQVGEETPIRVIDVGAGTQGGVPPRATVQLKETGIILRVKPHVTGDQVLLDLHAERSNIAVAPSDIGVTFQTQESATQVLVRDGETVVIGGLTIVEKSRVRVGIPYLMDLPLLGALFRSTSERETKKDLLIMVTPHIVREAED